MWKWGFRVMGEPFHRSPPHQAEGYASLAQPVAEQIAAALTRIKKQRKK
jgi:hypothetical protein